MVVSSTFPNTVSSGPHFKYRRISAKYKQIEEIVVSEMAELQLDKIKQARERIKGQ